MSDGTNNTPKWVARRQIGYKIYQGQFTDIVSKYQVIEDQTDDQLVDQVVHFFRHGSELIYPAKFIFCNIVYGYYLSKYFGVDFYHALNDPTVLFDSPVQVLYNQKPTVYDRIIDQVINDIDDLPSVVKTRHYFKMEMLINDEDISDVVQIKLN